MSRFFVSLLLVASSLSLRHHDDSSAAAVSVSISTSTPLEVEEDDEVNDGVDFRSGPTVLHEPEQLSKDNNYVEIDPLLMGNNQRKRKRMHNIDGAVKNDNTYFPRSIVMERFSRAIASEISRRLPFLQLQLPIHIPINLPWWRNSHNDWKQKEKEAVEAVMPKEGEELEEQIVTNAADSGGINLYPPQSYARQRERWVGAWCPPEFFDENDDNAKLDASEVDMVVIDKSLTIPYHSSPEDVSPNDHLGEGIGNNNQAMVENALMEEDDVQPGMVVFIFPHRVLDGGVVGVGADEQDVVAPSNRREELITSFLEASTRTDDIYDHTTEVVVEEDDEVKEGVEDEDSDVTVDRVAQCLHELGQQYDHDARVVQYALIGREPVELGIADVHRHDFAYHPVALTTPISQDMWSSSAKNDATTSSSSISRELQTAAKQSSWYGLGGDKDRGDDQQVSYRWFSWVTHISQLLHRGSGIYTMGSDNQLGKNSFLGSSSDLDQRTTMQYQSNIYEEDGKRPFAGGSHGEIWRARRRCPIILGGGGHEIPSISSSCDDDRDLIVKRLKIEYGYPILEAGLREIYFGELLAREVESSGLFTSYIDHFFREGHRGQVELWIVFENAGMSLRSYLYTPVDTGDYLVFQHSAFWRKLRWGIAGGRHHLDDESLTIFHPNENRYTERATPAGRELLRGVLKQLISSVEFLHKRGIVHRDIKPSNIMCKTTPPTNDGAIPSNIDSVLCLLGDFSSAWDEFSSRNLYAKGPSFKEQTNEYAPPEVLFQGLSSWIPFCLERPNSYDSWSIGVVALELLLGTPNIFSVDQRTTALLTNRMTKEGASPLDIQRALYLAALSQFCIYVPTEFDGMNWPLRRGDPLYDVNVVKQKCSLKDFHNALRARDPLGIGFDEDANNLLHLVWRLLAWDPMERLSTTEALNHPYFTAQSYQRGTYPSTFIVSDFLNALEHQTLDPRLDMSSEATVAEFICPKCGRKFSDHNSCQHHARSRRHALFCTYDRSLLPQCLNAHTMLPTHSISGYCDIQGRRKTIEDFHTVHLNPLYEFYGIFDGHLGNLASKYASSSFHHKIELCLSDLDKQIQSNQSSWREDVGTKITQSFEDLHHGIVNAVTSSPGGIMDESGTTATILLVTELAVIIANVGDSRAVMSQWSVDEKGNTLISAMQLTVDHVASSDEEQVQIIERGGFISQSGGIDRVMGSLAVSRSLGDIKLASVLSRAPHVLTLTKEEIHLQCGTKQTVARMPCFIVLASDGLWDVIDNQDAVDLAWQVIHGNENDTAYQDAAEVLAQEAYVRGSSDNIGVCVVAIM